MTMKSYKESKFKVKSHINTNKSWVKSQVKASTTYIKSQVKADKSNIMEGKSEFDRNTVKSQVQAQVRFHGNTG